MKVGIAIDTWKLPYFEKHLKASGFTTKSGPGLTEEMTLLTVETGGIPKLEVAIRAANEEAIKEKRHGE
jgi:hypothetical protein